MEIVLEYLQLHFGFSWKGFLVFLLPMIPNLVFLFKKGTHEDNHVANKHKTLDIIEHSSQGIFAFFLLFFSSNNEYLFLLPISILCLLFYYILWIIYFTSRANFIILMLMAIVPVAYFISAEVWLNNFLALLFTLVFGLVHMIITYKDFHNRIVERIKT